MNNAQLKEIYESIRKWKFGELIGLGDPEEIGMGLFQFVTKRVPMRPDMRILDLGCGLGRSSAPFVDYVRDEGYLVGVDVVERMASFCRDVIGSKLDSVKQDGRSNDIHLGRLDGDECRWLEGHGSGS